jgi:hypothetical protein
MRHQQFTSARDVLGALAEELQRARPICGADLVQEHPRNRADSTGNKNSGWNKTYFLASSEKPPPGRLVLRLQQASIGATI